MVLSYAYIYIMVVMCDPLSSLFALLIVAKENKQDIQTHR